MPADRPQPPRRPERWWRPLTTVRARTTAAATVVVGVALVLAAAGLLGYLERSMVRSIDEVAQLRAEDIEALVRQDVLPATIAVVEDDTVVQVVDDQGRVLAASGNLGPGQRLATFAATGEEPAKRTLDNLPGTRGEDFRVIALRASGATTIYVATSLEPVDEITSLVRRTLAVGVPVLLALVAVTAWAVIGRALGPVEAIRAQVADISEQSLDRRVPVPPTDDEVGRLAATMNTMLDRLQAAADRQRRFVADASHELRTPLASTRTDLEVALAHPDGTDWVGTATDLLAANLRMEQLVTNLLYLARADDPAPQATMSPVDLDDIVLAEAASLRSTGSAQVDTSRVSAAAVPGRREDLTRVVRNLLDNAGRHAASTVTIALGADNGRATLTVDNDGPAIPAAERQRIFERFTRLDDSRSAESGGAGLGLAITKEILEAHGGTVAVPDGARFVVTLPTA